MACRNIEYLRTFSVTPLSVWLALHMQVLYLREYNCKENEGISTISSSLFHSSVCATKPWEYTVFRLLTLEVVRYLASFPGLPGIYKAW